MMEGQLAGRIALITGASSGLGAHFAEVFVAAGARVVIGARRIDRVAELAGRLGDTALPVAIDVTDEASIAAAFDAAEARFGTVDTIVANAGQSNPGRATDIAVADLRSTVDVNFTGVFLTAREGARRLIAAGVRETGKGRVVLLGSITAHMTAQGDSAYAASKAAVAHLGRNLAREWVRAGINVNVIQPGYIRTGINGDWFDTEGGMKQIAGWHRRRLMPLDALDPTLLYLASDASAHLTGAVIDVDDGQSL
jgi:NAD(P)-dependent dehydrogenase (short-subunit alcohol dehydrogenase family)